MTNASFHAATASSTNYAFCVVRIHYGYGNPGGCPGTNGTSPMLVQSGDTVGGGTMHFVTANAPANAPALYLWGLGAINAPFNATCSLLVNPVGSTLVLLDGNGRHDQQLTVPPGILGTFHVQTFVLDAGSPLGFTMTNGVSPAAN